MENCISVVGLGLIGGSIAKALKIKAGIKHIIGVEPDEIQLNMALKSNVIDEGHQKIGDFLGRCSMVFICTPVSLCADMAIEISKYISKDCIITDVASTKTEIVNKIKAKVPEIRFVGGHPMAGSERSGFQYSREDMFENAYYIILDSNDKNATHKVSEVAKSIGATPIIVDSQKHDSAVAVISHIPHVTAAALVNLLNSEADFNIGLKIASGGFRDITRIASSNPVLWKDITISNRQAVSKGIDNLIEILNSVKNAIKNSDSDKIENFFKTAKNTRDVLSGEREGLLPRKYQVVIQVWDKPGVIAHIAKVLGDSNINIKNINVAHSREDIGGVLVVEFYEYDDRKKALLILKEYYDVVEID